MNNSVLTNIFTANVGTGANPLNIVNSPKTAKFTPAQKNNEPKTAAAQSPATDNTYDIAQKTTSDEPQRDFSEAMSQVAVAHKTSEAQNPQNTGEKDAEENANIYGMTTGLTPEQLELTKYLVTTTAVKAKGEAVQKPLVKPENTENSVKVPDNPEQSNAPAEKTQVKNKPSVIDANTETAEAKQTENKPSVTIARKHPGQENISLGDVDTQKIIEIKPGQGKDTANVQTSVEAVPEIKIVVNQQETQQTASKEIANKPQTPSPQAKQITVEPPPMPEPKSAPAQINNTIAQPTVNADKTAFVGEKPAELEKPDSLEAPKAPKADENTVVVENKSSNRQQDSPTALEEKVPAESKPGNSANAGKQNEALQQVLADTPKNQQSTSVIDNLLNDLNPQQAKVVAEVTASQTKTNTDTTIENNSNITNFAQVLSQSSQPQAIAEPTAVGAEKTAMPASVSEQIQETITASLKDNNQQITIQLDPPQLGKVTIKFQQQDGQITGELQVDKTQTRYEIERALPQIIKNMQDAGIQIKRIEVVLNNQPEQQSFKEQTGYDGNAQNQNGSNSGANQGAFTPKWSPDIFAAGYFDSSSPYQMQIADGAINMLA